MLESIFDKVAGLQVSSSIKKRLFCKTSANGCFWIRYCFCVCLGLGLTTAALVLGIANFQKGNQARQQLMMRARVAAQGGTVLAMIGGLYMAAKRNSKYSWQLKTKEHWSLIEITEVFLCHTKYQGSAIYRCARSQIKRHFEHFNILQNLILDFCIYDELLFVNFSVFIFFKINMWLIY